MAFVSSSKVESTETYGSQIAPLAPMTATEKEPEREAGIDIDVNNNGMRRDKANERDEGTTDNIFRRVPPQLEMVQLEEQIRELNRRVKEDREQQIMLERALKELQRPIGMPELNLANWYESQPTHHYDEDSNNLPTSQRIFMEDDEGFELMRTHRRKMIHTYRIQLDTLDTTQPESRAVQTYLEILDEELRLMNRVRDEREEFHSRFRTIYRPRISRRSSSEHSTKSMAGSTVDALAPPAQGVILTPPTYTIANLNYVEWAAFKAIQSMAEKESFAIDVLRGKPDVTFVIEQYYYPRQSFRRGKEDKLEAEFKAGVPWKTQYLKNMIRPLPGQAPLPERIRIHSKQILKILSKIHGDSLSRNDSLVVIIRPFRALTYYHDRIREYLQSLESKFGTRGRQGGSVEQRSNSDVTSNHLEPKDRGDSTKAASTNTTGDVEGQCKDALEEQTLKSRGRVEEVQKDEEDEKGEGVEKDEEEIEKEDLDTTSAIALQQLRCLNHFIDREIQAKLNYLASDRCKTVPFTDLWYLFSPGDEVVEQGRRQAYRVVSVTSTGHKVIPSWPKWDKSSTTSDETLIILKCVYIDFDGKQLGPVVRTVAIPRYDGEKAVNSLEVYPLRFAENPNSTAKDGFRRLLIARGRRFLDVAKVKHMHYNGLALEIRDEVDSQVVIDFEEAFSSSKDNVDANNKDWKITFVSLLERPTNKETAEEKEICVYECCRDEVVHQDDYVEKNRNKEYIGTLIPEDRNMEPSIAVYPRALQLTKSPDDAVTKDELIIMSYRVFGFVLRSRKWGKPHRCN